MKGQKMQNLRDWQDSVLTLFKKMCEMGSHTYEIPEEGISIFVEPNVFSPAVFTEIGRASCRERV